MGDLATLPTFQPSPTAYTHTDFNAFFAALTIAPGAVTFSKMQAVNSAVILGRLTAAAGNVEALTAAQARQVMELGDMALQDATDVHIVGGDAELTVLQLAMLRQGVETGYPTSGAIPLNMSVKNQALILLAGNATFTVTGPSPGVKHEVHLKNNTGAPITLGWAGVTVPDGVVLPTSLNAGKSMLLRLYAYGTTSGDVVATYN